MLRYIQIDESLSKQKERFGGAKMTTLEKDMREALEGNEKEVLLRRKAEIKRLTLEGKGCKNGFRRQCIAQQVVKLEAEYRQISNMF